MNDLLHLIKQFGISGKNPGNKGFIDLLPLGEAKRILSTLIQDSVIIIIGFDVYIEEDSKFILINQKLDQNLFYLNWSFGKNQLDKFKVSGLKNNIKECLEALRLVSNECKNHETDCFIRFFLENTKR